MKQCIIDTTDKDVLNKLTDMGYICHSVIPSTRVSPPICCHSDALYLKLNQNTFIISSCQLDNKDLLEKSGYNVIVCDALKPGYKTECFLNYIINDKYVIKNPSTAFSEYDEYLTNLKEIDVKQGYTRCSTICVNSNAYITDDEGIYKTLKENEIDCIKISKGEILLEGYDYGFIGGASVKLNDSEILFFGDFDNQNDKSAVVEFLKKYNMNPIFIENKKLIDLGSAIII